MNLTPPLGATFNDSGFDPISPTVYARGGSCGMDYKGTKNARSSWYTVHGTTPPAAMDLDSEQITFQVDNKWRSPKPYNKHQNGISTKQQYRLKSQQFQVEKMKNTYKTRNYDCKSPLISKRNLNFFTFSVLSRSGLAPWTLLSRRGRF